MNEKFIKKGYFVEVKRSISSKGETIVSELTLKYEAVSAAQAQRLAETEFPGWTVKSV